MIGRLAGELIGGEHEGTVTIDVNGVGYDVTVPLGTIGRATARAQAGRIVLIVHTHVREDALDLFGFSSELERRVFRLLLGVPNVGPKIALAVLSALPAPELVRAVVAQDLARLHKVTGVGKKTAERLVLELKEKLLKLKDQSAAEKSDPATGAQGDADKLISALTNMGYRGAEAERAVAAIKERIGREPLSDLLRAALAELAL